MNFDAAIRQNRRGRIRVARERAAQAMALLQDRMLITERCVDSFFGVEVWEGYAPDFAPLPLGAAAPLYQALGHNAADGSDNHAIRNL